MAPELPTSIEGARQGAGEDQRPFQVLLVDDEVAILESLELTLSEDYTVFTADNGRDGLRIMRDEEIDLVIVDQVMPEMSGTQFLAAAVDFYPDARKVLLTAYADTQAAISGINDVGLDYYLMKPWDPPEERLFPVLDDLLQDWAAGFRPPFRGIKVAGAAWSPASHEVKAQG